MTVKTVRLTTRPSSAGGRYEGYESWVNKWVDALEDGLTIKAANITGQLTNGVFDYGRMNWAGGGDEWVEFLKTPEINKGITYVIKSYGTPIALWSEHEEVWFVPALKYSRTTTSHQSKIHTFLRRLGYPVVETPSLDN